MRESKIERKTKETKIKIKLNIDGQGKYKISTSKKFFDHMLETFSRYSLFDIEIKAEGDLTHHLVEDIGIAMGMAFCEAIGDKKGINRVGTATVPMDDSLVMTSLDIGGRHYKKFDLNFKFDKIEEVSPDLFLHFLDSFAQKVPLNLFIKEFYGDDDHHKMEAAFKSFGKALLMATSFNDRIDLLSTKGVI